MSEDAQPVDLLIDVAERRHADIVSRWLDMQAGQGYLTDELRTEADELFTALTATLRAGTEPALGLTASVELREALRQLSLSRARDGASPTDIATGVLSLKYAVIDTLLEEGRSPDDQILAAVVTVNRFIDVAAVYTFETFVESREEVIVRQNQQLMELSTPVVQLWDKVLALPLIGTLDSSRTQIVMESLLQAIDTYEARIAIIDITGVPTVDTLVAQHLLQTVTATRLMGADCVISGIRPQIAQTIVQLGIDLADITTRATLADALATAIEIVGPTRSSSLTAAAGSPASNGASASSSMP